MTDMPRAENAPVPSGPASRRHETGSRAIRLGDDTRETLYVTDAELIRRSGVPEKVMRALLQEFDRNPGKTGFPQKVRLA